MGLRERCKAFYQKAQQDAMLRQNSPVDELVNFVVSEIGRAADERLNDSLPLCLYFHSKEDREEFVAAVHEAKPNMIARKWP
jgi:hypothetical protein